MKLNGIKDGARIVVAMSGGVDSSTVAALTHEAGYNVIGMTMQLYDHGAMVSKSKACCAGQDINDAREVAEKIGIPHYVLNYENLFKQSVMDDFANSYVNGETPIPCVRCNQTVKFRDMLKAAKDLNADALVTGHYIQRKEGKHGAELHRGADHSKDQSYFLFTTTREQLDFLHFPLGGMSKAETREHAKRFGLSVADKPDSQDICFVPDGNYAKIVAKLRPEAFDKGEIVHLNGKVMGEHNGIANFTIGQSRNLGLGHHEKLYVIKIDPKTRQVFVGPREALGTSEFFVKELNWLGHEAIPAEGLECQVKLRSVHEPVAATIYTTSSPESLSDSRAIHNPVTSYQLPVTNMDSPRIAYGNSGNDARWKITLHNPQDAVTPGQACVIYNGERMLGGGWITRFKQ